MLIGDTGSSTWASRNVSPVTGPVPPTAPVEMPPSTPLPLKSAALNRSFRLTGGISLGISVGGMTVWNPRGGGLAVTIASGGGVSGGGGGGGAGGVRRHLLGCPGGPTRFGGPPPGGGGGGRARQRGANNRGRSPAAIPMPVSATVRVTRSASWERPNDTVPPPGVYLTALVARLRSSWRIRVR